jgi:hypothetical protein
MPVGKLKDGGKGYLTCQCTSVSSKFDYRSPVLQGSSMTIPAVLRQHTLELASLGEMGSLVGEVGVPAS